jgi:chromosome partitioning protein
MTRIVAFFNQKGGTAKTTSTLNVAAALNEQGRSVLTIDLDPQASLTMAMGVDIQRLELSIYDLLIDEEFPLSAVVTDSTVPGVKLLPSHPDLATAELALMNELERERRLDNLILRSDLSRYDYVLIDSPPALNILSVNILVAADDLVIPIEPHPLSMMVLRRLFETIQKVRRLNPELRILGFLPTKVHRGTRLSAEVLDTLREQYPDLPHLPSIPLSVKSAESTAERASVLQYMPRSPVAEAYREVGAWLEMTPAAVGRR